ncbi:MAG: formylglycine-generating enzyme family protein [Bacteroidota bacterium]|nr:formylglycine-generating enzyme family protein [Bacteroidota bacterium]
MSIRSQTISDIHISDQAGLNTDSLTLTDNSRLLLERKKPVLSFLLNEKTWTTADVNAVKDEDGYSLTFENRLKIIVKKEPSAAEGWICDFVFENISSDTVSISNVVPFDSDGETVNITGKGPWDLARAWLFRPGFRPVRVILPDNAWELGYTSFMAANGYSVCAVTRRQQTEGGLKQRYGTLLPARAKVYYRMYADVFRGEWQEGLRKIFRDKLLYDLKTFDNTLYDRSDLAWIKESYLIILYMAWDREFFDRTTGKYTFPEAIRKGNDLFGNVDVFALWPTWPRLGLDDRNQWDLYGDLPGGTPQLRTFSRLSHMSSARFFITYNPWDNSTRREDHYKGMARIIQETEADGVVLDTRGSSSRELQAAADSVRKGVIMYSEGMAVTKDMPGIIAGRVHNAIYLSPELNLNKLIKPDFSIFRVCDVGEDVIHREIAIAFFNGYGTELNMYRPGGRGDSYRDDLAYLSRTIFILRQNNDAFLDRNWTPLIKTRADNIFVNRWQSGDKTIYTILNMRPEGFDGGLFATEADSGRHFVSLWNHEIIVPIKENGQEIISTRAEGWPSSESGTRKEGSVDCIASFPVLIGSRLTGDSLHFRSSGKGRLLIWKGDPSYKTEHKDLRVVNDTVVRVKDLFGYYEGKIVLQLIENKRLKDEEVRVIKGGKPWLVSRVVLTPGATGIAPGMVLIPGADFSFNVTTREDFIIYPEVSNKITRIDSFLIDRYPVTNAQYYEFLQSTGYRPIDTTRYLRHWDMGIYRQGQENYPVVYVSTEDIKAFTRWAGKRLPTEAEWQLAAQGLDKRIWPWGNEFHGTSCNNSFGKATPVDAFPKGASQYGVMDLVGNIWQVTNDMYFNGSYYFTVIRGGSFFQPESSEWYIQGGPQSLDRTQIMLLVSPGFDRSATVGFRCVKDIDSRNFKSRR